MNIEKPNFIKNTLEALALRSCENGTLENKNGKKEKLNFNGKPFVKNLDFNTKNPINSIPLKFNCNYETYSFNVLDNHITNLLSSKISFCVSTILDFWKNNVLNNVYDEELNQLISKLNVIHGNDIESIISNTIIEKLNEIKKLSKQRSSYDFFIKFNSKMDFAKTSDEKIIGKKPKSKDGEDITYVYRQVFINEVFPLYKLLTNSKSNTIFGITFDKKEIESLKAIFQFIFKDIDKEDDTQYFNRDKDFNTKKIIVEDLSLEYAGLRLLRKFDKLAKQIDNCLLKFRDYKEYDVENQMIHSNFTNEMFSELVFDMDSSSSDFEKKEVRLEIISQSKFTAEALNKELNEKSIVDNTISKKTNYKERKAKNFNYPYHRNSREEFSSFSNGFMKSDSPNLLSKLTILDPDNDSFHSIIPISEKLRHLQIIGSSGSGKTILTKSLAYVDSKMIKSNLMIFDILDNISREFMQSVAKENLLLINLSLEDKFNLIINPFDWGDKKIGEITEDEIESRAKAIINAFEVALGIAWSINMEVVLVPCISTLLRKGYSDIFELQRFMDHDRNEDLIDLGKKSPIKGHKNFFETQFCHEKFDVTIAAISTKLQTFLNNRSFSNSVIGKSTINLEKEINTEGKVIIFQLPKEANLFTRLMVEMIQEIVKKRVHLSKNERIDTYIYFDEFQNYITPTMEELLAESRNFGLYARFIYHSMAELNKKMQTMILSCTNIKFVGKTSHEDLKIMSKEIQVDVKQLEVLDVGEFFLKVGVKEAIKIKTTDKFVNIEIDEEKHQEHIAYQLEHYYTKIEDENIIEAMVVDDSKILAPTKSF